LINLIYIRAAIREKTGQVLKLEEVRDLLLEEGLITRKQAADGNLIFRGYDDFFETDVADKTACGADVEPSRKPKMAMGGYMKINKKKPMGASNGGYMKKKK